MKTNFLSDSIDIDTLVFENRNKSYGAYDLRRTYEERLTLSTMATVSFFMLLFTGFYFLQPNANAIIIACPNGNEQPKDTNVFVLVQPPKMFPPVTASGTVVPLVTDEIVRKDKLPKENKDEKSHTSGDGTQGTGNDLFGFEPGLPGGEITDFPTFPDPEHVVTDYTVYFDDAPEFQGGQNAYERYLQKHIDYPELAISNNIEGTIHVMVKINEKGKIVSAEILKGIGGGCDQEALRVIKGMPDWKPGKQNGKAVPVKCVLRVKMLLQN